MSFTKSNFFSSFFVVGFLFLGLGYLLPYLILGHDTYIRIHDTLEGELTWLHLLKSSGYMNSLSNDIRLEHLMDGLPRNVMPAGYTLFAQLCNGLDIFYGYIFAQLLFRWIGYASMYYWLKRYINPNYLNEKIIVSISFVFGCIQFFPPFGLSVIGLPLLAIGFARLYQKEPFPQTLAIFFLFPFMSSLIWSGMEVLILFGFYICYRWMKDRKLFGNHLYAYILFVVSTVLANLQMINGMFFLRGFQSHRIGYNLHPTPPDLANSIIEFVSYFFYTHYHISIFVTLIIVATFLLAYFYVEKNSWAKKIAIAILCICLWQGFYNQLEYYLQNIELIKSFRFNRFGFLLPFLWMTLFVISLNDLARNISIKKIIPFLIFSQFIVVLIANDEWQHNYKKLCGLEDKFPSYNDYLAINQFKTIEKNIPATLTNRVISLGLSPTIAQYHNYSTLDGLFSVYDWNYKQQFRKIMEKELDKHAEIKERFDNWGNRCYLYSAELGVTDVSNLESSHNRKKINHLEVNTTQLRQMGAKYVFSACKVENAQTLEWRLVYTLGGQNEFWTIYIYQI